MSYEFLDICKDVIEHKDKIYLELDDKNSSWGKFLKNLTPHNVVELAKMELAMRPTPAEPGETIEEFRQWQKDTHAENLKAQKAWQDKHSENMQDLIHATDNIAATVETLTQAIEDKTTKEKK